MDLLTFAEQVAQELDRRIGTASSKEDVARDGLRGAVSAQDIRAVIETLTTDAGLPAQRGLRPTPAAVAARLVGIVRRAHPDYARSSNARFLRHAATCRECRTALRMAHLQLLQELAERAGESPEWRRLRSLFGGEVPDIDIAPRDSLSDLTQHLAKEIENRMTTLERWGTMTLKPHIIRALADALDGVPERQQEEVLRTVSELTVLAGQQPDERAFRAIVEDALQMRSPAGQPN